MKTKILISIFILLIFSACSSPEEPDIPMMMINIEGIVTDADTGMPIDGAIVTVYSTGLYPPDEVFFKVATNHEGNYYIHEPFPKERCWSDIIGSIKAGKRGYRTKEYWELDIHCPYRPRCTVELQKIDFQLAPLLWDY